jgi:hypothetical protein
MVTIRRSSPKARRSLETCACKLVAALAGGRPDHNSSIRRSAETTWLGCSNRIAKTDRCLRPPSATSRPPSCATSSGPRIPNRIFSVGPVYQPRWRTPGRAAAASSLQAARQRGATGADQSARTELGQPQTRTASRAHQGADHVNTTRHRTEHAQTSGRTRERAGSARRAHRCHRRRTHHRAGRHKPHNRPKRHSLQSSLRLRLRAADPISWGRRILGRGLSVSGVITGARRGRILNQNRRLLNNSDPTHVRVRPRRESVCRPVTAQTGRGGPPIAGPSRPPSATADRSAAADTRSREVLSGESSRPLVSLRTSVLRRSRPREERLAHLQDHRPTAHLGGRISSQLCARNNATLAFPSPVATAQTLGLQVAAGLCRRGRRACFRPHACARSAVRDDSFRAAAGAGRATPMATKQPRQVVMAA